MTIPPLEEKSLKQTVAFAVAYGVLLAALQLTGFWSSFGINPMEFISAADILKLGAVPLLGSVLLFLSGAAVTQLTLAKPLPVGGGADTPIGRAGRKYWRYLVAGVVLLAVVTAIYAPEPLKWISLAGLVGMLAAPLSHIPAAMAAVPNDRARFTILWLLLFLPVYAFGNGRMDAYMAKAGRSKLLVDIAKSNLQTASGGKPLAYLGRLGDRYFVYDLSSRACLVLSVNETKALVLVPNEKEG